MTKTARRTTRTRTTTRPQRGYIPKPGTAAAILINTICRKKGATNEELCQAVGWEECLPAVKKYAAKAGVALTTKKEPGQLTRYFGRRRG